MHHLEKREPGPPSVTDECGRTWSVREIAVSSRPARGGGRVVGRIFSCEVPGPIPELRRSWRPPWHLGEARRDRPTTTAPAPARPR